MNQAQRVSNQKLKGYFQTFISNEQTAGIFLIIATLASLVIGNSPLTEWYHHLWETPIGLTAGSFSINESLEHWINDGLMAVFFLFVGLEIKREVVDGELSTLSKAALPVTVALGGMIFPALFYALVNHGTPTASGWGIPMATDIAFALGVLSMLGSGVPNSLKVFLVALAVADDLGAIVVIAVFYNQGIEAHYLLFAAVTFAVLVLINRLKVQYLTLYLLIGMVLWYFVHESGIHATIAGVLLAMTIPINENSKKESRLHQLEHALQVPVNFIILPLFAMANTGIALHSSLGESMAQLNSIGIFLGLYLGKCIGIVSFTYLAAKTGLVQIPRGASLMQIIGIGFLGGIGFTMSIFMANLSFADLEIIESSKMAILLTSLLAGLTGFFILKSTAAKS